MATLLQESFERLRVASMPKEASAGQVADCQTFFMAGAFAFYTIMMSQLEPGTEETPADMELMESLSSELDTFFEGLRGKAEARGNQTPKNAL